ncbi:MAG: LamG domain-containing protein, partial [Verrucomicrobiota bacterium]
MKRHAHSLPSLRRLGPAAAVLAITLVSALLAGPASAQSLKLQFSFEDEGTTTTDAIAGTVLTMVDGSGAATNLHTAIGSGVAGMGRALDFGAAAKQGGIGPVAYSTNNTTDTFGTISNFTLIFWIKPSSALLTNGFPRFFTLGTNGIIDHGVSSLQLIGNGSLQSATTSVQAFVNTNATSTSTYGAFDMPTGQWSFLALVYSGTTLKFYGGSEAAPVALRSSVSFAAGDLNLSAAWSVLLGNRLDRIRAFQGLMDEVRLYVGAGDSNFLESVRVASMLQPTPEGVVPATVAFGSTNDGSILNPAFCGLSYEKSQLTGSLFVSNNISLINMLGQIAPAVLRL